MLTSVYELEGPRWLQLEVLRWVVVWLPQQFVWKTTEKPKTASTFTPRRNSHLISLIRKSGKYTDPPVNKSLDMIIFNNKIEFIWTDDPPTLSMGVGVIEVAR